jgi:hypothetical protein
MFSRHCLRPSPSVRFGILALLCTGAIAAAPKGKQGNGVSLQPNATAGKIDIKSVVKVLTGKDTLGYSIAYEYEFPQRASVYIEHLGTVPAKGHFRYISMDKQLEFREGPKGNTLATVPLQETIIVAAKPPLMEMPDESEFPEALQEPTWDSPNPLHERANEVLGKYFHYHPRSDKGVVYLRTTFTPLPLIGVRQGVTAKLALLLVFPDHPEPGKYSFSVKSLVREGRTHSDEFRPTTDTAVMGSANLFVSKLVAEMKAPEANKP